MSQALMIPRKAAARVYSVDFSTLADGSLPSEFTGATWTISSGVAVNTPTLGEELFTNPGAEGEYTDGLAPNWNAVGVGTASEEGTIIHGGSAAQKFVGGGSANIGVSHASGTVTAGNWYVFDGWFRASAIGLMQVVNNRITNIQTYLPYTADAYVQTKQDAAAASTGAATFTMRIGVAVEGTFYADDISLKQITKSELVTARTYKATDFICAASINAPAGGAGLVVCLDSITNPTSYFRAMIAGRRINIIKSVSGTETLLQKVDMDNLSDHELLEIRKVGTSFSVYYGGIQVGTTATVSDPEILANRLVGMWSCNNEAYYNSFSIRPYSTQSPVIDYSTRYTGITYPSGNGVLSLEFADNVIRDYTYTYPELTDRSLTAGFSVVRKLLVGGAARITVAQARTMQAAGMEMICHGWGEDPETYAEFVKEVQQSVHELNLIGLDASSFIIPGEWTVYPADDGSWMGSPEGLMLRAYYMGLFGLFADFDTGSYYNLPITKPYDYKLVAGDTLTLVQLTAHIDAIIAGGLGMLIGFHSVNIGSGGDNISEADFESFLDYVETKVGLGTLTVLTPTQQLFATVAP